MELPGKAGNANHNLAAFMTDVQILAEYLPEGAIDRVYDWIRSYKVHFRITRARTTKLGDYRPPAGRSSHRISVNHNLNPYAFLITFVHEMAHLIVHEKYGRRVQPHGREWREEYRDLMLPFLDGEIFPSDIRPVLRRSLINTKASSTNELALSRVLLRYDKPSHHNRLEELGEGQTFQTENGRIFRKGERIRTRYKCLNLQNNRYYLFHPLTPVIPTKA